MKPLQASLSEKEGTIEALKKEIALKNEDIKKYQQRDTDYVTKYVSMDDGSIYIDIRILILKSISKWRRM